MNGHFQLDSVTFKDNDDFPEVGIFQGLPEEEYHDLDARASSSILRKIQNKTPAHAKASMEQELDTSAIRFGSAMHQAVLEPNRFAREYAVSTQCQALKGSGDQCGSTGKVPYRRADGAVIWFCGRSSHQPDLDGGDPLEHMCPYCDAPSGQQCHTSNGNPADPHKKRRELAEPSVETPDGEVGITGKADIKKLTEKKADRIESMRSRLEGHPSASKLLFQWPGLNELTIVFEYSVEGRLQVPCKARIDRLVEHPRFGMLAVDYKTTQNAQPGPHDFGRSIDRRRYDMQGDVYVHGCRAMDIPVRGFVIVAQEKQPPYEVSCQLFPMEGHEYVDDTTVADLQTASTDVKSALRQWTQCAETGNWPGYADPVVVAEVPSWSDVGTLRD